MTCRPSAGGVCGVGSALSALPTFMLQLKIGYLELSRSCNHTGMACVF
jgi:hypothetical protein